MNTDENAFYRLHLRDKSQGVPLRNCIRVHSCPSVVKPRFRLTHGVRRHDGALGGARHVSQGKSGGIPPQSKGKACVFLFSRFLFSGDLCISWLIPRFRLPAFPPSRFASKFSCISCGSRLNSHHKMNREPRQIQPGKTARFCFPLSAFRSQVSGFRFQISVFNYYHAKFRTR